MIWKASVNFAIEKFLNMGEFNEMQRVKRRLFAMRNGALADSLRKSGAPYRIIFGVNLPQLVEIAGEFGKNADLAERLWQNTTTRESLLLAPMLYPASEMTIATALRWGRGVTTAEVADVLCLKLLKYLEFADELADKLVESGDDLQRYCGLRLMMNRFPNRLEHIRSMASDELERANPLTASLAKMMIDEVDFWLEN